MRIPTVYFSSLNKQQDFIDLSKMLPVREINFLSLIHDRKVKNIRPNGRCYFDPEA